MIRRYKKYSPNLSEFMALSAANYAKFLQLLPKEDAQQEDVNFELAIDNQPNLQVCLQQQSRYTETYQLRQMSSSHDSLGRCYLVRLYHDAKVAEVLSGLNDPMLPPVYPYPNDQMKQPDEKLQLNKFLGEWLSFCLQFGQAHSLSKTQLAFLA